MGDIDDRRLLKSDLPEQAFRAATIRLRCPFFSSVQPYILAIRPPIEGQYLFMNFVCCVKLRVILYGLCLNLYMSVTQKTTLRSLRSFVCGLHH